MLKGLLPFVLVPLAGVLSLFVIEGPPSGTARVDVPQAHAVTPVLHAEPAVDLDAEAAAEQERAVAAYLAAVDAESVRLYLEAIRPRIAVDWGRWERLHVCEQPGNWYANGGNPADGARQVFQGGLGMSTGAWQMAVRAAAARGVTLPASALAASPEEQMTGAQAFYDAHGWGWACRV